MGAIGGVALSALDLFALKLALRSLICLNPARSGWMGATSLPERSRRYIPPARVGLLVLPPATSLETQLPSGGGGGAMAVEEGDRRIGRGGSAWEDPADVMELPRDRAPTVVPRN